MNRTGPQVMLLSSEKDDYYDVLGIQKDASPEEVKRSFKRQARSCHPDLHPDDKDAQEKFVLLNAAYGVLGDGSQRQAYDDSIVGTCQVRDQGGSDQPDDLGQPARVPARASSRHVASPGRFEAAPPPRQRAVYCGPGGCPGHDGPAPGFGTVLEAACPACRGLGASPERGSRCRVCGGRGWVIVRPASRRAW